MSTPPQSTVNANAAAAKAAILAANDAAFIASADIVIASVAAQGRYRVTLPFPNPSSLRDVYNYYTALGYSFFLIPPLGFDEWPGVWSYPYNNLNDWYADVYIKNYNQTLQVIISWK